MAGRKAWMNGIKKWNNILIRHSQIDFSFSFFFLICSSWNYKLPLFRHMLVDNDIFNKDISPRDRYIFNCHFKGEWMIKVDKDVYIGRKEGFKDFYNKGELIGAAGGGLLWIFYNIDGLKLLQSWEMFVIGVFWELVAINEIVVLSNIGWRLCQIRKVVYSNPRFQREDVEAKPATPNQMDMKFVAALTLADDFAKMKMGISLKSHWGLIRKLSSQRKLTF